jgi:hypothetical protein
VRKIIAPPFVPLEDELNSLGIEKPALETLLKCQIRVSNLGTKWSRNSKKVSILTGRVLHP